MNHETGTIHWQEYHGLLPGYPKLEQRRKEEDMVLAATNQCALDNRRMSYLSCRPTTKAEAALMVARSVVRGVLDATA